MNSKSFLALTLLSFMFVGCAAQRNYSEGQRLVDQGQFEEGLNKINEAAKIDPDNHQYRATYYRQREKIAFQLRSQADTALSKELWAEAAALYRRVLNIDPDNVRAKSAISNLEMMQRHRALIHEAEDLFKEAKFDKAIQKLQQVLREDPANNAAVALKHKIESKTVRAATMSEKLKSSLKEPITLEFRDATLPAIFEAISKTAGINFIFDKDIKPDLRATIFVRDVHIEDAIRFILANNQLESKALNSNTLFIYPSTPQKLRDFQELEVRSFYLSNADVKQTANMIKTLVKTKDIFVDEKLNLLVIRDTPEAVRVAEKLISVQDLAEPEVMLAVEVLEVSSSLLSELGIRYPTQVGFSVVGAAGTPGSLKLPEFRNRNSNLVNVSITDPALLLNLMEQEGNSNLLANPRIRVRNREKAKILIGDKVPVITTTSSATGFVAESVTYLDVGLKLDVESNVHLDDEVAIKIGLEVSNIAREVLTKSGSLTYQVGTRTASTTLRLKDGETQILAGLISNEDRKTASKVPGLGNLPMVGRLFSNDRNSISKTEIILLITPRIVRNLTRPETDVEEFLSGTEATIGTPPIELNTVNTVQNNPASAPSAASTLSSQQPQPSQSSQPAPTPEAKLTLDLPAQLSPGSQYPLQVSVSAENLQNAILDFTYDPSLFQVVNVEEGDFMKQNGGQTRFLYQVQESGHVGIIAGRQGNAQGSGKIATIVLKVIGKTTEKTQITLAAANLSDATGKPVVAIPTIPITTSIK